MNNMGAVGDAPARDISDDLTSSSENSLFAQPSTTYILSEQTSAEDIKNDQKSGDKCDDEKPILCEISEEQRPGIFCMFPPPPPSINFITEPPLKMLEKLKSMENDPQEVESVASTIEFNGPEKFQSECLSSNQSTAETCENKEEADIEEEKSEVLQNTLTEAFTNVFSEEAQKIGNLANQIVENLKETSGTKDQLTIMLQKNEDLKAFVEKLLRLLQEKTNLASNLEKQNTALAHQSQSLKDVINITKDLLNIRNMEVEHLHTDLAAMENMIKEERIRHNLSVQRLQEAMKLNEQLKKEYLIQMDLFQKLKVKFTERILDLSDSNRQFAEFISSRDLKFVPKERVKSIEPIVNETDNKQ